MNVSVLEVPITMIDGFPVIAEAKRQESHNAAISTSWVNGLIWGLLVFLSFLLFQIVLYFGSIEMFAFLIFGNDVCNPYSSKYWVRGIFALIGGILLGHVGMVPKQQKQDGLV